jgi:hypothetical protein
MQRFLKEAFGRLGIARRAQEQLERVAFRVDGPREIPPIFADFEGRAYYTSSIFATQPYNFP